MKNLFSLKLSFTLVIFLLSFAPVYAYASTDITLKSKPIIEYLEDGSYFESIIYESNPSVQLFATTKTKNGQKTVTHYSSSGIKQWSITVNGTFSYNGSTSSCTAVSGTKSIYNSNWKISITSISKSGNCASTTANGKYYLGGNLVNNITKTASLRCKPDGTLY